ncbi:MAG: hypothetical protein HY744_19005 [Deltaproteobacteria bacterium]|nr:hypothetical protein [Deltaproteobacteria bacterium]
MSSDSIVLAQLQVQDCTAELYVNGIPLIRLTPARVPIENVAVEHLLVPSTNSIEVVVEPGPSPSLARTGYGELGFRAMEAVGRLVRFPEGVPGLVEHGELLGETRFGWASPHPERRAFPAAVSTQVELGPAHGRWAWQDAPQLTLDQALLEEACALIDRVEAALRAGLVEPLWQLAELQVKDVLRAYPALSESELRADLAELLHHHQQATDPVIPHDPSNHDFRLVAGGKLLELCDRDWTTSIKLRDPKDGSPVPYRLFVARIGPALRIVR